MSDYEFTMRATPKDLEGYYYPNWDNPERMTILAATKRQAIDKAAAMLGELKRGYVWTFKVDDIKESRDPNTYEHGHRDGENSAYADYQIALTEHFDIEDTSPMGVVAYIKSVTDPGNEVRR